MISVGGDSQVIAQEGNITGKGLSLVSEGKNELKAKGNVILETARTEQNGVQGRKSHGIGELTTSETEHFFGYHRERYNQEGDTLTHQGSQIASLNSHVKIEAGQDYRQVSSSLLAKDTLDVTAQNLYFDATHNLQRHQQSQSDLKIGQFSRIKSPIIDMIQTTERLVKNKAASDRLKVANAMGLAAQGYALYDNINKMANQRYSSAYLLRVESGVGVAHSRQKQEVEMRISQGNLLNATHIHLNAGTDKTVSTSAEAGNIRLTHTTLTSRDDKGQRIAGSTLSLTGRQIDIQAGESRTKERSRGQNIGAEVGAFAQVGAQSGMGAYATLGGGNQKANGDSLSYHNSQLDSEHVTLRSRQDMHLVGAKVQGKRVDIEAGGNLHIESRQDESRFDSRSTQAGVNAEVSFGNAWSANGNVSAERGKSNYKQVRELSGIMAEEGGYHVVAENVHLKGAVIASTNPAQSELTTNRFSFEDIKNESSYSASSASISGGYSKGREYYRDADTHKVVSAGSKDAEFIAGKKGANFNAGLPMHSEGSEESLTKATLTAGRITLNKDSQPVETTADALGINTDLSQAQREVSKPKDVTQLLAEQKEIAKAVGEIKSAVEIYTSNQQEEAELAVKRAKKALAQAEQTGNQTEITQKQTALLAAEEAQAKWGDKGEYKRTAERLTTLLTGILAKQAAGGIATQLISPEVNQWIKEATTNDKGETDKIANTLAHAIWGAIEATANRGNPTSGAIAAASAELAAPMLAKVLYNKDKAEHLTAEEKAQITALSSITAAVAGGLTAQDSSQSNTTVSSLTHASIGGEIGKIAVENNYLFRHEAEERARLIKALGECRAKGGDCTKIENRITELTQLDNSRNKKLNEACGYKMTPNCAKELVTLSAAHKSFKDYKPQNHYDSVVYSDFKEVEELYGEAQSRRMEHLAKQALLDISTHEPVENAVTLTRITIDALKGDETAKAQLRQIGNEIKKAALSPIDTISETTRIELKQADELEAAGYRDEADLIRMKVYLSNEIIAIGTFSSVSGLIHSGIRNVGKLAIKEGVLSNKEVKIVWGKGIEKQGKAWEEYLKKILPKGTIDLNDIKPNFKTFDRLLPDGTAISAKTMDTVGSKIYQNPKRITYQLNKYVDDMVNFTGDGKKGGKRITERDISNKEMYLAIPYGTSIEQIQAINKSMDYAKSRGVRIILKEVK